MFKTFSKIDKRVVFLCWFGYACAYFGRLDMAASLLPMSESLHWSKDVLGSVAASFFFAYAGGQLLSGILSHWINPRYSFGTALVGSALCNALVPLCSGVGAMRAVWFANGCVQALMWCSVIKAMSSRVQEKAMPVAIIIISSTISIGTVFVYMTSALFSMVGMWRGTFTTAAALLSIAAILWFSFFRFPEDSQIQTRAATRGHAGQSPEGRDAKASLFLIVSMTACFCLACAACGFLRDGLSNWSPSILKHEFGISTSGSTLLTLILPMIGILGAWLNKRFHEVVRTLSTMDAVCFGVATVCMIGALWAVSATKLAILLVCFAGVTLTMIMVTNAITSIFVLTYRRFFDSAFVAGLVDTLCYVGSSVSVWVIGWSSERYGWSMAIGILAAAGAVGLLSSLLGFLSERKLARRTPA